MPPPQKKDPRESAEYYQDSLDQIFSAMGKSAYLSIGRWSYATSAINPLIFNPGAVGDLPKKEAEFLNEAFESDRVRQALKEFSFTKLLSDNDTEIWFHFTNENAPPESEDQVYLGTTRKGRPTVEVAATKVTASLVSQIIRAFERIQGEIRYDGMALHRYMIQIYETLDAVIFSLLENIDCRIRHVTFMPVAVPSHAKTVVGIVAINSIEQIKIADLEPLVQPFVEGIMVPFFLQEIDEQRRMFSLRSAIAAIMSRNMSHNIGSHVLWHLSQQLKKK